MIKKIIKDSRQHNSSIKRLVNMDLKVIDDAESVSLLCIYLKKI